MSSGRLGREPQVLDVENAHIKELLEAGARNIAQGQRCGAVDPKLNPEITVALLMDRLNQAINSAITASEQPSKQKLLASIWRFTQSALRLKGGIDSAKYREN